MPKKSNDERFNEFLLRKAIESLGGEQRAYKQFYGAKVQHELRMDHTFADLWNLAEKEGWKDQLLAMKLSILATGRDGKKEGSGMKTRNPANAVEILAYIAANPGCNARVIKQGVSGNVGTKISKLVKDKLVRKNGDKAAATYIVMAKGKKELEA